ncbi:hypothetical protein CEXT_543541 [Caerostris extrusa]|uniref:Uncharacterized protein n=1 Tax=Caerostris extrusa TaxID=172846 RepID=A0AAV4NQ07_CAEEX|nr:hypothetical protein CEXT_543541 [Caerostris extrusa]
MLPEPLKFQHSQGITEAFLQPARPRHQQHGSQTCPRENASRIYHLETAVRNKSRFSKAIGRFYDGYSVPVNNGP